MNPLCTDFRARLARVLVERTSREAERFDGFAGAVAWHEHVLTCGACRELLESEEALEDLLASLPLPSLPPELARRVLQRLQPTRAELELDRLLDDALDSNDAFAAPPQLASDVLSRLRGARDVARLESKLESKLDALLARVPAPRARHGLSQRVLSALAPHREHVEIVARQVPAPLAARGPRPTPRPRLSRPLLAAAAVLVLVGGGAWLWSRAAKPIGSPTDVEGPFVHRGGTNSDAVVRVDPPEAPKRDVEPLEDREPLDLTEPDAELLAQLELLESWDLLTDESLDFELVGIDEDTLLGLTTSTGGLESDASNGDETPDSPQAGETRNG